VSDTATWRELGSPQDVAAALIGLYEQRGGDRYDEVISQTEHALQCGSLAMAAGADASTITAAFLHDVGHLLAHGHDRERDLRHEVIGARFLASWFTPAVTEPIRLHVAAKRYLCAASPGYHGDLSPASAASLVLQGGPMSEAEVAEFEREPFAGIAVDLRRWDDLAKVKDASTPALDEFRELMIDLINI